ncbi:MAG: thiamine pyrophosphate-binding protein, partial [Atopobiaceae bacterium]|nr:thiamine pyrophosphate-binding protein [Atopobiaceae bacterium]
MGLFSEEGYLEVGEFLLADDPLLVPDDYSAQKIAWQERLFSRQVSDVIHMRTDEELRRFCGNRHCEKSASCLLAQNEKHTFAQLFEVYSKTPSFASDAAKQVTSCDFVVRHYTTMAVVELCALKNLRFAINYNFDTVVEETLYEVLVKRLVDSTIHEVHIWTYGTGTSETTMRSEEGYSLVLHQGGWTEGIESIARHDAIHFFHVHGVSTDWNQEAQAGTLVFSHHSYRDYQSAPFSWSNQVLQYLFSLCNIVGVGFSGVDPNFRYFAANYAASTENDANMPSSSAAGNVTLIRSEDSYREAAKNITGNRDVAGFLEKQAKGMVEKYYKRYYKVDINWVSSHLDVAKALHFAATERCGSTAHSEKINPNQLVLRLKDAGLDLWAGVPDSLLKDLCAAASDELGDRFVIAANEGNAVGIACGWHVATGRAAVVYMQNSGEGNAVNPLLSLADPDVYGMPILLVIGWRGEPGVADEPQHVKQGKVTLAVLEAMGVPYEVLDAEGWEAQVEGLLSTMREEPKPVAFVVRKGAFSPHPFRALATDDPLTREEALSTVLGRIGSDDLVVSTTGKESREVFELREARGEGHDTDFLT